MLLFLNCINAINTFFFIPKLRYFRLHFKLQNVLQKNLIIFLLNSFDARDDKSANYEDGKHWHNVSTLGNRAYFEASTHPALLTIESTTNADSGLYRCRTDFRKSPTRNSKVNLQVISEYTYLIDLLVFYKYIFF